jgi:hypothetical protein
MELPMKRMRTEAPSPSAKITPDQWETFDREGYVVLEPDQVDLIL